MEHFLAAAAAKGLSSELEAIEKAIESLERLTIRQAHSQCSACSMDRATRSVPLNPAALMPYIGLEVRSFCLEPD